MDLIIIVNNIAFLQPCIILEIGHLACLNIRLLMSNRQSSALRKDREQRPCLVTSVLLFFFSCIR